MTEGYVNCLDVTDDTECIMAGSYDTFIYCLSRQGSLNWKYETKGIVSCISINNFVKRILVGSHDRSVYCFDYEGDLAWTFSTKDKVLTCATFLQNGRPYYLVGSTDWTLYCLDEDGNEIWKHRAKGSILSIKSDEDGEKIFAGTYDAHIYCFDITGSILWKYKTGDYVEKIRMSEKGDIVIASSKDKHLYLFTRSGEPLKPGSIPAGVFDFAISSDGKCLIIGTDEEKLVCIDFFDEGEEPVDDSEPVPEKELSGYEKKMVNTYYWQHVCPHCRRRFDYYYQKKKGGDGISEMSGLVEDGLGSDRQVEYAEAAADEEVISISGPADKEPPTSVTDGRSEGQTPEGSTDEDPTIQSIAITKLKNLASGEVKRPMAYKRSQVQGTEAPYAPVRLDGAKKKLKKKKSLAENEAR
jgi:WD40 repeat protein